MKTSGKFSTVFSIILVIIAILLVTMTAVTMFLFQKEIDKRELTETTLKKTQVSEVKLQTELQDARKQLEIFDSKNKELDNQINDLLGELDIEKGLRDEARKDSAAAKEALDKELQSKTELQDQLNKKIAEIDQTIADHKKEIEQVSTAKKELEDKIQKLEERNKELENAAKNISSVPPSAVPGTDQGSPQTAQRQNSQTPATLSPSELTKLEEKEQVQLDPIVVGRKQGREGRVLSVDNETEFVVINLGEKDGLKTGDTLSVYRGQDYLGDIKITRLQPEMAAADLIPPFMSKMARKNDQVVFSKQP